MTDNYRSIAGPMCGNCNHSRRKIIKNQVSKDEWSGLWCNKVSEIEGRIMNVSEHGVCHKFHEFKEGAKVYFTEHHNGALPVTVMIPKDDDNNIT